MLATGRYIDPFTDFGFKKLFGSAPHKDLLIDFLNALLEGKKYINTLRLSHNEHMGKNRHNRKAVFDLYCETDKGEHFVIELQKVKQKNFKERSLYYTTFPIQEQSRKGPGWNYALNEVYAVNIMDFAFEDAPLDQYLHEVKLVETKTKEVFYDKLTFIFLEMSKFNKKEADLVTRFDKWLYLLRNLSTFNEVPAILDEEIFRKAFQIAEVANLNFKEMCTYDAELKVKRDNLNAWNYAIELAVDKAVEEAVKTTTELTQKKVITALIRQMNTENIPASTIAKVSQVPITEVKQILAQA